MALAFSYEECRALIENFARDVPAMLARHPRTADLALRMEKLGLSTCLAARFSVAIVGQMRVGKSTLLNALIGRDLAPTGVNETTATVNWFRPDPHPGTQASLAGVFRVHDRDGGEEDFPLDRIGDWLGRGECAQKTRRIDFYADTPFLRRVDLIDTPGLRSVIETHQDAAMAFLEERLENESITQTNRADAIIYAINPVARETDSDMLALFGDKTRLPGAAVWNSLAVVQKWEHLSGDPLEEIQKKCARLRRQLDGKVAAVISTSGLLARLTAKLDESVWDAIARLAQAPARLLDDLLEDAAFFLDDPPGVPVDAMGRAALKERVPWPCLRLLLLSARSRGWRDAETVRAGARAASGIDELNRLLDQRFFALSSLIKVGSVMRKAVGPCHIAMLRLRAQEDDRRAMLDEGKRIIERLAGRTDPSEDDIGRALDFIRRSLPAVETDLTLSADIQIRLERSLQAAHASFAILEGDVEALDVLASLPPHTLDSNEISRLRALFGVDGPNPSQRLGISGEIAVLIDCAETFLEECRSLLRRSPSIARPVYLLACDRLEQLANHLDAIAESALRG